MPFISQNCYPANIRLKWFFDNLLKLNNRKCHLVVFGNKSTEITIKIGNSEFKETTMKLTGNNFRQEIKYQKAFRGLM